MKTRLLLTLLGALAAGAIGLSGTAVAQGQGGGGGNGGGGDGEAPDFGDLIILYRDANGVPIPSGSVQVPDPESGQLVDGGLCWQPIASVDFSYDGWGGPGDRVVVPTESTAVDGGWLIPVDQYTCGVEAFFGSYTEETDFGRINEARSPASVFEAQLEDVVIKLATADSTSLDPAGRMVASNCGVDEETVTSTIDSPLQNLAAYRQLMLTGTIGVDLPEDADNFDTAARGLGVASDKGGKVTVDMVAYLNMLMGLDDVPTFIGKLCETYREEVQGTIQPVEKCFLNYGSDPSDVAPIPGGLDGANYLYTRSDNFSILEPSLPLPSYIPQGGAMDGWFEYLVTVDAETPLFTIAQGPILNGVFCVDGDGLPVLPTSDGSCPTSIIDAGFLGGNIGGFAQAADDTRAVINFMHDWPMPDADVFGTAVPCAPSGDILYDLAISEQSGLQVPKNYVNGGEREFFVNVGNLGPDEANGTVTVVANGAEGQLGEWVFPFTELPVGQTASFTGHFTIDTTSSEIAWSATVVADPPGTDPNPANNTRDAISKVRASGGGGGH
jgi:hypothetical protein